MTMSIRWRRGSSRARAGRLLWGSDWPHVMMKNRCRTMGRCATAGAVGSGCSDPQAHPGRQPDGAYGFGAMKGSTDEHRHAAAACLIVRRLGYLTAPAAQVTVAGRHAYVGTSQPLPSRHHHPDCPIRLIRACWHHHA
jgi:hypothetical protein